MILDKRVLSKLRKALKGKQNEIAKIAGVDRSTVSRVLNGDIDNESIISHCMDFAKKERKKSEKLVKEINSL